MIKFFKLFNGEEVTAEVDEGTEWSETIEMRRPFRNVMTDKGPALFAYPCDVIEVSRHHVVFSGVPHVDLANGYRRATGGIVIPSKDVQLPDPMNNRGG